MDEDELVGPLEAPQPPPQRSGGFGPLVAAIAGLLRRNNNRGGGGGDDAWESGRSRQWSLNEDVAGGEPPAGGEYDAGEAALGVANTEEELVAGYTSRRAANRVVHKYGTVAGIAVILNCIIGTGVFGLPYAFYQAGEAMSFVVVTIMFFSTLLSCYWVLEIMARAHGLEKAEANKSFGDGSGVRPNNSLEFEKYDYTRCCTIFGGTPGKIISEVVMILYCYGGLWASVSVFASSLASLTFELAQQGTCDIYHDPSAWCDADYYISALFYGVVVVTLSCMEVSSQIRIQMALTAYRFMGFALIILTVIIALAVGGPLPPLASSSGLISSSSSSSSSSTSSLLNTTSSSGDSGGGGLADLEWGGLWGVKLGGFTILVTSAAYSYTVHYNMPDALTPVRNKTHLRQIMLVGVLVSMFFFQIVGILCSAYFGSRVDPLVILNWEAYTGRDGGFGTGSRLWFAWIVYAVIMLYPICNLISVYPLVAISLASNVEHVLPARFSRERPKLARLCARLLAAVPPIILGTAFGQLNVIFTFTGLFAFFIQFFIPCVMWELSRRRLVRQYGTGADATIYGGRFISSRLLVAAVFVLGLCAFVVALAEFVMSIIRHWL
eukprot:TRINITY_DN771_c0_g1_i12.p1 TRINITY_DN771_c0_g1~~TRINITY_DN771_c0_g1_i12.p1  ORF type:complete len:608 (-),score=145.34 TRINITY_DN771_c0_g1_i12:1269-3092(-)